MEPLDPLVVLSYEPAHTLMDHLVLGTGRQQSIEWLGLYFHVASYTGQFFNRLDGSGHRPEVANRFAAGDLATLPLLGVNLSRGDMVVELLYERADELNSLLAAVPADVALHEASLWFNHHRLFQACGDIPPAELETAHHRRHAALTEAGHSTR